MKEVAKISIGILILISLIFAVDWIVGTWSENMYYKSKYGIFYRQIYCLTKSQDDVVIFGSSRAAHHYVPQMFEDSLGLSCYNAGSDGMCIYYHYGILASMLQRKSVPKIVILDVLDYDVEVSKGSTFSLDAALDRYAPHYGEFKEIDNMFSLNGWQQKIKMIFKTYRYNSKLVQIINCNYIGSPMNKGYEALTGVMNINGEMESNDVISLSVDHPDIEMRKVEYLKKFISDCKANNIKLVMCYSPYYGQSISQSIRIIKEIAMENDIDFLNYGDEEYFQNPCFFQDAGHLNDTGAREYSKEIVKQIKLSLQEKVNLL